jgi:hypothetical protein
MSPTNDEATRIHAALWRLHDTHWPGEIGEVDYDQAVVRVRKGLTLEEHPFRVVGGFVLFRGFEIATGGTMRRYAFHAVVFVAVWLRLCCSHRLMIRFLPVAVAAVLVLRAWSFSTREVVGIVVGVYAALILLGMTVKVITTPSVWVTE